MNIGNESGIIILRPVQIEKDSTLVHLPKTTNKENTMLSNLFRSSNSLILTFCMALSGVGCGVATEPDVCEVPSYPNVNGLWMEIHPAYIEIYGCETFEEMSIEDFSGFCAQFQDGDGAISSDPDVLNCDETSCEFYWVCDCGAPAR